ncbi:WD repeat-containing protein 11 [Amborella trichopoda]|uniref:Uncharacterized protein n=1 Tax=Amborella trichopoda TaxID=13333 RepID=W1P9R7_AMBTC|nr:WD repeat-containing protein 11 [Amborella trichopoda]ERN03720.1 hypothetical protein AMTR_s00078p00015380 [Amborella trichopoda]|eukprot:XP_006842045.1 WD repeat-containing protein 11 [Amborella trichopoda]
MASSSGGGGGGGSADTVVVPGPSSRNNGGCADCSSSGLLAYGAGSCVVVVETVSMQVACILPMPSSAHSLAPFVTALRWPPPSPRSLDNQHGDGSGSDGLRLAVGDRQGRIAIWDAHSRRIMLWMEVPESKAGVQDLCWLNCGESDHLLLASITGPSLVSLWNPATGRCVWKYDASPEYLSCIRRDPFDSCHTCVLGLKAFLLSLTATTNRHTGVTQDDDNYYDISFQEHQLPFSSSSSSDLATMMSDGPFSPPLSPALSVFPQIFVKFVFSPLWKHILYIAFPRELLVFDLQYRSVLFSTPLPRGCARFLDLLPDPYHDLLYCIHLDGKLSIWKRKDGEQAHVLCTMEELIPSIGITVPSPGVLAVVVSPLESNLRNIGWHCLDTLPSFPSSVTTGDFSALDNHNRSFLVTVANVISISDDGKIWKWLLSAEGRRDGHGGTSNLSAIGDENEKAVTKAQNDLTDKEPSVLSDSGIFSSGSSFTKSELALKIALVGQLHLLSSTLTMLAVPSPSLTATLARGGNNPAAAVPLVALGTQHGNIDVVDVAANAVAASFSVHVGVIRGLKWLGNSRLVSFSYSQANDKGGGYTNRLVITCLRTGLNRTFRVLQKPERAPIRALRASSSGRYLLILFRDAPVEVWAMTKNPVMLRSLALPFTVMEWSLPTAPKPVQRGPSRQSSFSNKERPTIASAVAAANTTTSSEPKVASSEGPADEISESFAFALVNGALGVFEVLGRRIRDFRPKWPSSSFVSSDGLVSAMAYRLPHVVLGDRSGNIRWWDVTTGLSSSFNTHREGIRRIKFSPVVASDHSRGRVAVLFYDNTFSIFDLDTPDPLANALLQPQFAGTLVLELDWLPLRTDRSEPLMLCIAGADSSFRLVEVNIHDAKSTLLSKPKVSKEIFRPMPLCSAVLLPPPHAMALRMALQLGVKPSWFDMCSTPLDTTLNRIPEMSLTSERDLRGFMIESNVLPIGDSVVPEMLLKVLEPYRREGCLLDNERASLYATLAHKGSAFRFAFAAALFGDSSEAFFWLQLPRALLILLNKSVKKSPQKAEMASARSTPELGDAILLSKMGSMEKSLLGRGKNEKLGHSQFKVMAFEQEELHSESIERIRWHEKLDGEDAIQKRVHELVSVGNLEAAVTLLLSTPPEGSHFYVNALRAVALSSAVSRSLHELAVKVVAANMVRTDKSLSGVHLLCAVGRYQEACSQLQDAGCWTDAATLAATHLQGSDFARVLQRWADHVLYSEHNIWRALILYVAAGALYEALAALRNAQLPDTAAMFLMACHEISAQVAASSKSEFNDLNTPTLSWLLPSQDHEDVVTVCEYFVHYQRKLVHLCMDCIPSFD